jgi:hypothetical protein
MLRGKGGGGAVGGGRFREEDEGEDRDEGCVTTDVRGDIT